MQVNGEFNSIEKSRVINKDSRIHYSIFYVTPTIRLFEDSCPSLLETRSIGDLPVRGRGLLGPVKLSSSSALESSAWGPPGTPAHHNDIVSEPGASLMRIVSS